MASVWMAKETGALAKQGLDTEVISMPSSSAIPALIASEIDVVQVSAAPVITASVRGLDAVFVAGLLNTMIWDAQTKYIIGKLDDAGWQAEIDKWRKAGGDQLIKEYEGWASALRSYARPGPRPLRGRPLWSSWRWTSGCRGSARRRGGTRPRSG